MVRKLNKFFSEYACTLSHLLALSIGVWSGCFCHSLINKYEVFPVLVTDNQGNQQLHVFETSKEQKTFVFMHKERVNKLVEFHERVK